MVSFGVHVPAETLRRRLLRFQEYELLSILHSYVLQQSLSEEHASCSLPQYGAGVPVDVLGVVVDVGWSSMEVVVVVTLGLHVPEVLRRALRR